MNNMKKICSISAEQRQEAVEMTNYIFDLLRGTTNSKRVRNSDNTTTYWITEKRRQYFTWGVNPRSIYMIAATDGSIGVQFKTKGLKHRGRVRIYYNYGTDLFDVEFIRERKDEAKKVLEDIPFDELHNVCHRNIEREDDPEV